MLKNKKQMKIYRGQRVPGTYCAAEEDEKEKKLGINWVALGSYFVCQRFGIGIILIHPLLSPPHISLVYLTASLILTCSFTKASLISLLLLLQCFWYSSMHLHCIFVCISYVLLCYTTLKSSSSIQILHYPNWLNFSTFFLMLT